MPQSRGYGLGEHVARQLHPHEHPAATEADDHRGEPDELWTALAIELRRGAGSVLLHLRSPRLGRGGAQHIQLWKELLGDQLDRA